MKKLNGIGKTLVIIVLFFAMVLFGGAQCETAGNQVMVIFAALACAAVLIYLTWRWKGDFDELDDED